MEIAPTDRNFCAIRLYLSRCVLYIDPCPIDVGWRAVEGISTCLSEVLRRSAAVQKTPSLTVKILLIALVLTVLYGFQ
jgi:hypothetical protein